jgi:hypothetical protein
MPAMPIWHLQHVRSVEMMMDRVNWVFHHSCTEARREYVRAVVEALMVNVHCVTEGYHGEITSLAEHFFSPEDEEEEEVAPTTSGTSSTLSAMSGASVPC